MSANRSFAHEDPAWTSLAGRPCIVVGNSPAERIAATGILSARFTIGVNRALRTWSPSALVIVDRGVIRKEADNCRSYRGMLERVTSPVACLPSRAIPEWDSGSGRSAHKTI